MKLSTSREGTFDFSLSVTRSSFRCFNQESDNTMHVENHIIHALVCFITIYRREHNCRHFTDAILQKYLLNETFVSHFAAFCSRGSPIYNKSALIRVSA